VNQLSPKTNRRYHKKELYTEFKVILRVLTEYDKDKLNVNKIVRIIEEKYKEKKRTGLKHKPNITKSIEKLEKVRVVKKEKTGKQKELVVLTPIGKELSEFVTAIENYNLSYFNMVDAVHKKVSFVIDRDLLYIEKDQNEINNKDLDPEFKEEVWNTRLKLIENGWKQEEIKFYNRIRTTLIDFKVVCDNNFINILISRYSRIIKIHDDENIENPLLLRFLHYLVKESVTKKIDFMLKHYQSEIFGYTTIRQISQNNIEKSTIIYHNSGDIYQYFLSLYVIFYDHMITTLLEKEVENMLIAYLELLQIPQKIDFLETDSLEKTINDYDVLLKNPEEKLSSIQINEIKSKRKTANILLKAILDYNTKQESRPQKHIWIDIPFVHC